MGDRTSSLNSNVYGNGWLLITIVRYFTFRPSFSLFSCFSSLILLIEYNLTKSASQDETACFRDMLIAVAEKMCTESQENYHYDLVLKGKFDIKIKYLDKVF